MKQVILLSYPRSGNTWCRYIIETLFNIRTTGYDWDVVPLRSLLHIDKYPSISYRNDFCVVKRHGTIEWFEESTPLIFIYRDVKDAIKRNLQEPSLNYEKELERYYKNISEYNRWTGHKIKIDYNTLISEPLNAVDQMTDIFKLYPSHEEKELFVKNIKYHIACSVSVYCDVQKNRSFTYNKNV